MPSISKEILAKSLLTNLDRSRFRIDNIRTHIEGTMAQLDKGRQGLRQMLYELNLSDRQVKLR